MRDAQGEPASAPEAVCCVGSAFCTGRRCDLCAARTTAQIGKQDVAVRLATLKQF